MHWEARLLFRFDKGRRKIQNSSGNKTEFCVKIAKQNIFFCFLGSARTAILALESGNMSHVGQNLNQNLFVLD